MLRNSATDPVLAILFSIGSLSFFSHDTNATTEYNLIDLYSTEIEHDPTRMPEAQLDPDGNQDQSPKLPLLAKEIIHTLFLFSCLSSRIMDWKTPCRGQRRKNISWITWTVSLTLNS